MKKTPDQIVQTVHEFCGANGMDLFKGSVIPDNSSGFLTITWNEEESNDIESFLRIAKNHSVKILYISKDLYSKDEFAKLRDSFQILIQNKSTAKDLKESFRESLSRLESLDEYDSKILSVDFSYVIDNRIHTYTSNAIWIDTYDELMGDLLALEEEEEDEEED